MLISSVQFYDVILFFHVALVVVAFGPTFAYPVFLAVAERSDPRAVPAVGRGILAWDRIALVLLVGILLAGIYLTVDRWQFSDFYVSWGFVAVIAVGGLSGAFFTPKTKQAIEIAERDIAAAGERPAELSPEFQAVSQQLAKVGTGLGIFLILTIYVMIAKPFL